MSAQDRDFALVVGIDHYPGFRSLKGARQDARDFMAWLLDTKSGGGLPAANCRSVLSKMRPVRPIIDDIDEAFELIFKDVGKVPDGGRRFYLYFSGHGLGRTHSTTDLCLAKWSMMRKGQAIDALAYMDMIADSGHFQEIACFLDCCRIRQVNARGRGPDRQGAPAEGAHRARFFKAFASEFLEAAKEAEEKDSGEVRGHFTRALLQALKGAAATAAGGVSASSLKKYLETHTTIIAKQFGHSQKAEVANGFPDENEPVFGLAVPAERVPVTIHIEGDLNVALRLEGPDLEVLFEGKPERQPWQLELATGLHLLTRIDTGEERSIRVRPGSEVVRVGF